MLAPSRRGPHPFMSHPPLPSWQGDWEKAASFKSAQRLWSCPELSEINHGASDFCFASEGGVGTPRSFCLLHPAPGCVLITNRQGPASPLPPPPLLPPLTLPLSRHPPHAFSSPSCLPSSPSVPPLTRSDPPHTPSLGPGFSPNPIVPSAPPPSRMRIGLAFSLYIFIVSSELLFLLPPLFYNLIISGSAHPPTHTPLLHLCVRDSWKLSGYESRGEMPGSFCPLGISCFGILLRDAPRNKAPLTGRPDPQCLPACNT